MPLGQLVGAIPQGYAALGCFQRIQAFLLLESYLEQRHTPAGKEYISANKALCVNNKALRSGSIELEMLSDRSISQQKESTVVVQGGIFGWSASRPPILDSIDVCVPENALITIVIGSVGCGKSTLLRGILGETSIFKGLVTVMHREIAYCDQTPWITNASVRENVIGESTFENVWYNLILRACCLVRL